MNTAAMMGTVVGRAAALCRRLQCDPRAICEEHLGDFQALLKNPDDSSLPARSGATSP